MDNKPYICTNSEKIKSECISCKNDYEAIINDLLSVFPEDALGLAAPQILLFKRVFIARIKGNLYAFVNPSIVRKSPDTNPSTESCLSIPNLSRTVSRHKWIDVTSDKAFLIENDELINHGPVMKLHNQDSFVFQHEFDHLNGVLITDLPEVMTQEEKFRQKIIDKQRRKAKKKHLKKLKPRPANKSTSNKSSSKSIEIDERRKAQQSGLFD